MKLVINYDLMKKIKESNNGKNIFYYDKFFIIGTLIYSGYKIISNVLNGQFIQDAMEDTVISFAAVNLIGLGFSGIKKGIFNPVVKEASKEDLQKLISDLNKLEVNTSLELFQETKINTIEYEFIYKDDSLLPNLKKNTYIDIPLNNGYEETILQEHIIGEDIYEISVRGPVKNKKVKLVNA